MSQTTFIFHKKTTIKCVKQVIEQKNQYEITV